MANTEISIDKLATAITEELTNYQRNEVDKAVSLYTELAMEQLVQDTKATAPVGHRKKHYKSNITSKVLSKRSIGYGLTHRELWYVKGSDYRLTHLLNNGHALRNGGRYPGTQFLSKAVDTVVTGYLMKIEEVLERGFNNSK